MGDILMALSCPTPSVPLTQPHLMVHGDRKEDAKVYTQGWGIGSDLGALATLAEVLHSCC